MSYCPEAKQRNAMTDAEFWDHVFHRYDAYDVAHWVAYFEDIWALDCARCGMVVEVNNPENRERDGFCDDCADEMLPDDDGQIGEVQ